MEQLIHTANMEVPAVSVYLEVDMTFLTVPATCHQSQYTEINVCNIGLYNFMMLL